MGSGGKGNGPTEGIPLWAIVLHIQKQFLKIILHLHHSFT